MQTVNDAVLTFECRNRIGIISSVRRFSQPEPATSLTASSSMTRKVETRSCGWKSKCRSHDLVAIAANHETMRLIAEQAGIPYILIRATPANKPEAELLEIFESLEAALIVMARCMQVLIDDFCSKLQNKNHQHSPLVPARLQVCEPIRAGLGTRRVSDRGRLDPYACPRFPQTLPMHRP